MLRRQTQGSLGYRRIVTEASCVGYIVILHFAPIPSETQKELSLAIRASLLPVFEKPTISQFICWFRSVAH